VKAAPTHLTTASKLVRAAELLRTISKSTGELADLIGDVPYDETRPTAEDARLERIRTTVGQAFQAIGLSLIDLLAQRRPSRVDRRVVDQAVDRLVPRRR
jgi:hypothetical protein